MKLRILLFLSMGLILILSCCNTVSESQMEATPLIEDALVSTTTISESLSDTNTIPANDESIHDNEDKMENDSVHRSNYNDEFQNFIETWKLTGLISEDIAITPENQERFIKYFEDFGDDERNYIMLLLQDITTGTITTTDDYNDPENGVYLNYCKFCIYDINQDGILEFILKTGSCEADYWYTVYTIIDGELVECGELSGSHASLYAGSSDGFMRYAGHMGVYEISISTLEGSKLITQNIANGELDFNKTENYPELVDYGYEKYDQYLNFSDIPTLMIAPAG